MNSLTTHFLEDARKTIPSSHPPTNTNILLNSLTTHFLEDAKRQSPPPTPHKHKDTPKLFNHTLLRGCEKDNPLLPPPTNTKILLNSLTTHFLEDATDNPLLSPPPPPHTHKDTSKLLNTHFLEDARKTIHSSHPPPPPHKHKNTPKLFNHTLLRGCEKDNPLLPPPTNTKILLNSLTTHFLEDARKTIPSPTPPSPTNTRILPIYREDKIITQSVSNFV